MKKQNWPHHEAESNSHLGQGILSVLKELKIDRSIMFFIFTARVEKRHLWVLSLMGQNNLGSCGCCRKWVGDYLGYYIRKQNLLGWTHGNGGARIMSKSRILPSSSILDVQEVSFSNNDAYEVPTAGVWKRAN